MLLGLCLSLSASGCARYERATVPDTARFEWLQRRQLSRFEHRLAVERQTGAEDAWSAVGRAWLALATCQPLDPSPFEGIKRADDPLARLVHATVALEARRRERLILQRGAGMAPLSITGTMFARLDDADFFTLRPAPLPEDMVLWPEAQEAWADEVPAEREVAVRCDAMYQRLFQQAARERAAYDVTAAEADALRRRDPATVLDPIPPRVGLHLNPELTPEARRALKPGTLAAAERDELDALARVLALGEQLPRAARRAESVDALLWRARFYMVSRAGELAAYTASQPRLSAEERRIVARWSAESAAALRPLIRRELDGDPAPVEAAERARALLLHAAFAERAQDAAQALDAVSRALKLGVDPQNMALARYRHIKLMSDAGRWAEVAALGEQAPAAGDPTYTAFVYRTGYAMRRAGLTDQFMAHAMRAFRDRPYRADPFMRALYIQLLRALVVYPFEPRIVEILEDMGERSLIYERVREYATTALDEGRTANARAAAVWLLARHANASFYPRYHAILALASFLEDDLPGFLQEVRRIATRPEALTASIAARRQPAFFAAADAQLADVLRQMLPIMAEWGEGARAEALRQRWLKVIVEEAQLFVRQTPRSLARPALIELYRIASALLDAEAARAYPERVGQPNAAPLILGTVRVQDRDLDPFEPSGLTVRIPTPFSLTLLPDDVAPLATWRSFWQEPAATSPDTAGRTP